MKEDFAARKRILLQKYGGMMERKQKRFQSAIDFVDKRIGTLLSQAQ
jgi:hypothetical protein